MKSMFIEYNEKRNFGCQNRTFSVKLSINIGQSGEVMQWK